MNIMEVDGYKAKIEYDSELDEFRGEILGLNGSADFYGKDPATLRREFKASLAVFLEVCEEKGINPTKEFSGRSLKDLGLRKRFDVNIVAIKKQVPAIDDKGQRIFKEEINDLPQAEDILSESNYLIVVGKEESINALSKHK